MIEKCADVITNWLVNCEVVKSTEKELYRYAVYSVLLSLSPLILALFFGIFSGCVWQSITIILPFMLIRKFSGGYHAKHPWSCVMGSSFLLLLCIGLSLYIKLNWVFILTTVCGAVSLICFSPMGNVNREISQKEYREYKRAIIILVNFFLFLMLLLYLCGLNKYSVCVAIGLILSASLQLPCILKNFI